MTKSELIEQMAGDKAVRVCKQITNPTILDYEKEQAIHKVCTSAYLMHRLSKTDLLAIVDWMHDKYMQEGKNADDAV